MKHTKPSRTLPLIVPASYVKANLSYFNDFNHHTEEQTEGVHLEESGKQERISRWEGPSW